MSLNYKPDPNIEFFQFCEHADLKILTDFMMRDKDGNLRISEELSYEVQYKRYRDDLPKIWNYIAGELQLFGGDTILNIFRGNEGVMYKEILSNVCKKLKVNYNKNSSIEVIESNLLMKVIETSLEKMTEEEKREFANQLNLNITNLSTVSIMAAIQVLVRAGGFAAYQISVIVANSVAKFLIGRGLTLAGNAALTRGLAAFAGPIGWAISVILAIPLISGPAYRVTIPCVIHVAYMRQKYINKEIL